ILRAIAAAGQAAEVDVVPTFFGAHAVPPEFQARPEAYGNLVREEMLPAVAANRLAESCDAFVDRGYFSAEQAREILSRGADLGFRAKVHADELSDAGGALLAAELEAASADHLIHTSPEGIEALARSRTIAILLPATSLASRLVTPRTAFRYRIRRITAAEGKPSRSRASSRRGPSCPLR